jgi:hypothetical protein
MAVYGSISKARQSLKCHDQMTHFLICNDWANLLTHSQPCVHPSSYFKLRRDLTKLSFSLMLKILCIPEFSLPILEPAEAISRPEQHSHSG